jgi:hypothetical protein
MILGPDDPRAITGKELDDARAYTEWFNREVLGMKPMTAKEKKAKAKLEADILDAIGWPDSKDPS